MQSAWFAASGELMLGRAPAHALFVGFFGHLRVAMVTRIVSEFASDALGWQAAVAAGWSVAFLPWVLRSAWIYLSPRADGHPG